MKEGVFYLIKGLNLEDRFALSVNLIFGIIFLGFYSVLEKEFNS